MGISIQGLGSTLARLTRISDRTTDAQLKELIRGGEAIEKLAKANAPYKTGALERSIKSVPIRDDVRRRYSVYVGVDETELGIGYSIYGFRYDEHLHDNLFKLGKGSEAKAKTGKAVGPEFLKRALDDLEDGISKRMSDIASRESGR